MPSKTFQPLLFDSFKYNLPHSTYEDHFHQRKRREFLGLDRKYKNLTQKEKMILLNKRSRPFTVASTTHEPPSFVLNSDNKIIYNPWPIIKFADDIQDDLIKKPSLADIKMIFLEVIGVLLETLIIYIIFSKKSK